jgi:hypothetical protein
MTGISKDDSYIVRLSNETKPTLANDKDVLLEVNTGIWYVFYKGTWYAQNTSPL